MAVTKNIYTHTVMVSWRCAGLICIFSIPHETKKRKAIILNLVEIYNEHIDLQNDIQSASFLNESEVVILTNKGEVLLYNLITKERKRLFETDWPKGLIYPDGGFDPSAESSIYTMENIIVVVNDYKKHGFVLNRKENYLLRIGRGDYHAAISKYPIALFTDDKDAPHLIYGVDWNHVHIANLSTRQVLTADKSLIEENAEQHHIDLYKKYEEHNKLLWPGEYDYFFSKLIMSPNKKSFLSAGWAWGSFDCYRFYNIEEFISNHRIKDYTIGNWEHNNRAICFVDDETVAVLYHPCFDYSNEDDDESSKKLSYDKDSPYEIRLYHTDGQGEKGIITLKTPLDLSKAELFYHQGRQYYYVFSEKIGIAIVSSEGELIFQESSVVPQQYNEAQNRFICYDKKQLSVFQIK